ncbi:MAG: hypothetical protein NZ898_00435 [Myxococcota bacterium]|nr:hypothetical protein [Myxococcota bacterium]MDW8362010.1 hypothetical protein [Myxococcales bacterium]
MRAGEPSRDRCRPHQKEAGGSANLAAIPYPRGATQDGIDLGFLERRVRAIEEDNDVLAAVGEAEAGKSTLINARIGEPLATTDVLRSSRGVVETFNSTDECVELQYADGHTEIVRDDPARTDLHESIAHRGRIAAIDDRSRAIPTALIDRYIVEQRIRPRAPILVEDLECTTRLPWQAHRPRIEDYVRTRSCADIPFGIRIAPLAVGFHDLRIVDPRGVDALGGLQDLTFASFHLGHAVLFVHSLDAPIEKLSFPELVTKLASARIREALFLVLSRSGFKSPVERDAHVAHSGSLFQALLNPHRIVAIDSMQKLVADDRLRFDSPASLKAPRMGQTTHFKRRYAPKRRSV